MGNASSCADMHAEIFEAMRSVRLETAVKRFLESQEPRFEEPFASRTALRVVDWLTHTSYKAGPLESR